MAKLKISSSAVGRATALQQQPLRRRSPVAAILGWLLAIGSGVACGIAVLHWQGRLAQIAAEHAAAETELAELSAEAAKERQRASAKAEAAATPANPVTEAAPALSPTERQARLRWQRQIEVEQAKLTTDQAAFDAKQAEYDAKRRQLGIPYVSIEELMAARQRLLDSAAATAAAVAATAAPEPVARSTDSAHQVEARPPVVRADRRDFEIEVESKKSRSRQLAGLTVSVRNKSFRTDYEKLRIHVIAYGESTSVRDRFVVMQHHVATFDMLSKGREKQAFNAEFPMGYVKKIDNLGGHAYEYAGWAVVVCDANDEVITGRTMKVAEMNYLDAYRQLQVGAEFNESLQPILTNVVPGEKK